jgi:HK97 family phage major capsid protein
MNLEALRASLREKHGALAPLREKAFADGAPDTDFNAYEQALKDCEAIEKKIELAEREEALAAKASVPALAPVGPGQQAITVPAAAKAVKPEESLALAAAAIIVGKAQGKPALKVLEDEGYSGFAAELGKKAINTLVSSEGGILVPTPLTGGIMPLLRARSTFLDAGPTPRPATSRKAR